MNSDPRFLRVRMRHLLAALADAGIDAAAIGASAARLAQAADAIDVAVDVLIADAVAVDRFAVAVLSADAFAAAPAEVRFRLIVRLLQAIGGEDYPARSRQVESLLAVLLGSAATRRTLGGVVVERRPGAIRFYRESGRTGLPAFSVPPGFTGAWDHRFKIEVAADAPESLVVGALGTARPSGLVRPVGLPAAALATLPAFFCGDRILAVPSLGWFAPEVPAGAVVAAETVSRKLTRPLRFPALAES